MSEQKAVLRAENKSSVPVLIMMLKNMSGVCNFLLNQVLPEENLAIVNATSLCLALQRWVVCKQSLKRSVLLYVYLELFFQSIALGISCFLGHEHLWKSIAELFSLSEISSIINSYL